MEEETERKPLVKYMAVTVANNQSLLIGSCFILSFSFLSIGLICEDFPCHIQTCVDIY
jgi:hypothetical protein